MEASTGSCTFCGSERVVYFRRYSGERLCARCFNRSMVDRVRRTISKYNLLRPWDRIAVAVSGGKDSLSLLKILSEIEKDYPRASLVAITIDEGIPVYREEAIGHAETYAEKLGIELRRLSFKELYGFTLTEAVESGAMEKMGLKPCTVCGVLRRKAITLAARRVGATVVATAHTLDDIVQTYLLNVFRGDASMAPVGLRREGEGVVPRVAPFRLTPEREVVFYAYLNKIPFQAEACPYASQAMRDPIRRFLTSYEETYPGALYAALNTLEKLIQAKPQPQHLCPTCGEPTTRPICRACEIEDKVKEHMKK